MLNNSEKECPIDINRQGLKDPLCEHVVSLLISGELENDIKAVQHHFRIGYNRAKRILEYINHNNLLIK